jgi:ATP-dependent DNA helicase DinG
VTRAEIEAVFRIDGPFSKREGYEVREKQVELSGEIFDAIENKRILMAEAGTGIGKSLAYIIPALVHAEAPIVISTNTKALQDQLVEKDIPAAIQSLGLADTNVCLAKGKSNFMCLAKVAAATDGVLTDFNGYETKFMSELINDENYDTTNGIVQGVESEFDIPQGLWPRISCDDTCVGDKCSFYAKCYFYRMRERLKSAKIIVCNHHLLAADLAIKIEVGFDADVVLPAYKILIVDEAHNLEDIIARTLGNSFTSRGIFSMLTHLAKDMKHGLLSSVGRIVPSLSCHSGFNTARVNRLLDEATIVTLTTHREIDTAFGAFQEKCRQLRVTQIAHDAPAHNVVVQFLTQILPSVQDLSIKLDEVGESVMVQSTSYPEKINLIMSDFSKSRKTASNLVSRIQSFLNVSEENEVKWVDIQTMQEGVKFNNLPIVVAHRINTELLDQLTSAVFLSATLTAYSYVDKSQLRNAFWYYGSRLGVYFQAQERVSFFIAPSPFDYERNAALLLPTVNSNPNAPTFIAEIAPQIQEVCEASDGGVFVLFTSHATLKDCYDRIGPKLERQGYTVVSQHNTRGKERMLSEFRSASKPILFGNATFWEGVDVPGSALRCVVLVKIPFPSPGDPLVKARMEVIERQGGSSFDHYMVSEAVIKFKQGFGRLIRTKTDRGVVVVFDNRLYTKGYGAYFIRALPRLPVYQGTEVPAVVSRFLHPKQAAS